jgi:DNA topoisomerase-3
MQLVIAEKPSVARDLARVLGVRPTGRASFEGAGRVITWCVGHLVELEEPAAYDPRWKAWRLETLPMLPQAFRLRPSKGTRDQWKAVQALLRDRRFTEVVNACDAGREGELIFRYAYELAGSRLPVRRLWISSLTDEAIRRGFAQLRPGAEYEPLADAARCRSEADWLVGLNATRAVTVRHRTGGDSPLYSIGRVQTPTLAILVDRERAIRDFVPQDYWELEGRFLAAGGRFTALWTHGKQTRLGAAPLAEAALARLRAHGRADDPHGPVVERVHQRRTREPPPLLFDLTSLQRTANRRFGLSAARTLEVAQALYERHKVLTYPRTDSRHLSMDMAGELPKLFQGLARLDEYAEHVRPLLADPPRPNRRVFDDAKVQDHHAIVPTGRTVAPGALDRDERRLFDLVVRRFIGAFHPDAEFAVTRAVIRVGPGDGGPLPDLGDSPVPGRTAPASVGARAATSGEVTRDEALLQALPPPPDRFLARGRVRLVPGWHTVAGIGGGDRGGDRGADRGGDRGGERNGDRGDRGEGDEAELPPLAEGQRLDGAFEALAKKTRPPPRHTEATLLGAMETAGRSIDDEVLREAMKERGLGTPATRASIIETLVKRGFVSRDGKQLSPTATGMALVAALPVQDLASPELTGAWEARLLRIARGQDTRTAFMADIASYVRRVVETIRAAPVDRAMATAAGPARPGPARPGPARPGPARPGPARPGPASTGAGPAQASRSRRRTASAAAGGAPARAARSRPRAAPASAAASAGGAAAGGAGPLTCPQCQAGQVIAGKRGWGCSRWAEGCGFVVWFDVGGKRLSEAQLRDLVVRGKTRPGRFAGPDGQVVAGRLVLDLGGSRERGAARLEPGDTGVK